MPSKRATKKSRHGMVLQSTAVALLPARSVTSHIRRRYTAQYAGRFRCSKLVFGFDLMLVSLLIVLLVLDVSWLLQSSFVLGGGLEVQMNAPPMRAADRVPVELTIRATDQLSHEDVRLKLRVPEWMEILDARPAAQSDGNFWIGSVFPERERTIHLIVRPRAMSDVSASFAFTLHQFDPLGLYATLYGKEVRTIQSSAITARPALQVGGLVSGASVPIVVMNEGNNPATHLALNLDQKNNAPQASFEGRQFLNLESFAPHEQRIVFLDVGPIGATTTLAWNLTDGAQRIDAFTLHAVRVADAELPVRIMDLSSEANDGQATFVYEQGSSTHARAFVSHPWLRASVAHGSALETETFTSARSRVRIPIDSTIPSDDLHWSVVPFIPTTTGALIGRRSIGLVQQSFPLRTEARYYTETGDQIGVGPHPPQINQATTYWIVWRIGPGSFDVGSVRLTSVLGDHVQATGKFATQTPGQFYAQGSRITWTIPNISASHNEVTTLAAEVRLIPNSSMLHKPAVLVVASHIDAQDRRTNEKMTADSGSLDTTLSAAR